MLADPAWVRADLPAEVMAISSDCRRMVLLSMVVIVSSGLLGVVQAGTTEAVATGAVFWANFWAAVPPTLLALGALITSIRTRSTVKEVAIEQKTDSAVIVNQQKAASAEMAERVTEVAATQEVGVAEIKEVRHMVNSTMTEMRKEISETTAQLAQTRQELVGAMMRIDALLAQKKAPAVKGRATRGTVR